MKIGIDFGGVIVKPADGDSPFDPDMGQSIEQTGAIESISKLIKSLNAEVWIISKASKSTQIATRSWLSKVGFYQETGFIASNLLFCSKRTEKRILCEPLGLTHFIDDSEEVLDVLTGLIPNLFIFGNENAREDLARVVSWQQVLEKLTSKGNGREKSAPMR
ncbi:hypothetical protein A9Q99_13955 [Gammaproteobacteria bacterium 45_16_T64]|nr:hypothetical protein A9Q99_13955 [Gammaproteobacteria bacterium 45_16_T64]